MAKHCEICEKKALKANKVSFSNKHHTYRQQPNLQTIKTSSGQKLTVCTSCIKANKVKKAV